MKRIQIQNEFTQWAEYLARYFGHDLLIYDTNGSLMWGSPAPMYIDPKDLDKKSIYTAIYKDMGKPIAYFNDEQLTANEQRILWTIVPFIESQLEDAE